MELPRNTRASFPASLPEERNETRATASSVEAGSLGSPGTFSRTLKCSRGAQSSTSWDSNGWADWSGYPLREMWDRSCSLSFAAPKIEREREEDRPRESGRSTKPRVYLQGIRSSLASFAEHLLPGLALHPGLTQGTACLRLQ